MKYTEISGISLPLSRIVLGTSGALFAGGGDIAEVMEGALACGINTIDTARVYGQSEETIGRWMEQENCRHRFVLISKGCHPRIPHIPRINASAAAEDLKQSLDALRTDCIDIYLLHRDDEAIPVGRIVDFLNDFREQGLIKAFGGSNWSARRVAAANAYAKAHGLQGFSMSSPHYSLGRQRHDPWCNGCRTVTGERHADERRWYAENRMPVLAWSSLCGGVFTGRLKSEDWSRLQAQFGFSARWAYGCRDNQERLRRLEKLSGEKDIPVSQLSIAWLLSDAMTVLPVLGASSARRLAENAASAGLILTPEEVRYLNLETESL